MIVQYQQNNVLVKVMVCIAYNLFVFLQGCREDHDGFQDDQPDWVAFTSSDYGYTKMTIHNSTHISFSQISDDQVQWLTQPNSINAM